MTVCVISWCSVRVKSLHIEEGITMNEVSAEKMEKSEKRKYALKPKEKKGVSGKQRIFRDKPMF